MQVTRHSRLVVMTNARILFTMTSPHSDIIENHRQKSLQKTEINTPMLKQYCRTTSFQKLVTIQVKHRFKKSGQRLTFCVLSRSEKLFYECKWRPLFFCNQNKSSLFHACYSAGKVNNPSLLICPYTTYKIQLGFSIYFQC